MEGRYQWGKRAGAGMRKAVESFQQAIGIDSNYALDMLDQSYAERSDHLTVIGIAPDVESLRC